MQISCASSASHFFPMACCSLDTKIAGNYRPVNKPKKIILKWTEYNKTGAAPSPLNIIRINTIFICACLVPSFFVRHCLRCVHWDKENKANNIGHWTFLRQRFDIVGISWVLLLIIIVTIDIFFHNCLRMYSVALSDNWRSFLLYIGIATLFNMKKTLNVHHKCIRRWNYIK